MGKSKTSETDIEKAKLTQAGYKVTAKKKLMEVQLKSEITLSNYDMKIGGNANGVLSILFTSVRIEKTVLRPKKKVIVVSIAVLVL